MLSLTIFWYYEFKKSLWLRSVRVLNQNVTKKLEIKREFWPNLGIKMWISWPKKWPTKFHLKFSNTDPPPLIQETFIPKKNIFPVASLTSFIAKLVKCWEYAFLGWYALIIAIFHRGRRVIAIYYSNTWGGGALPWGDVCQAHFRKNLMSTMHENNMRAGSKSCIKGCNWY